MNSLNDLETAQTLENDVKNDCCKKGKFDCSCNCEYCVCDNKSECECSCTDCCATDVTRKVFPLPYVLLAEGAGTFFIVFSIICASTYLPIFSQYGGVLQLGAIAGLSLLAAIFAFGRISKGYFNPAVTVGGAVAGKISWFDAACYCVAQVIGGLIAAIPFFFIMPEVKGYLTTRKWFELAGNGYHSFSPHTLMQELFGSSSPIDFQLRSVLVMEIIATTILTIVMLKAVNIGAVQKAICISATYAFLVAICFPVSSAGLNPARSIAVAFFAQDWSASPFEGQVTQLWVFIVAPLLGSCIAGLLVYITDGTKKVPVSLYVRPIYTAKIEEEDENEDENEENGENEEELGKTKYEFDLPENDSPTNEILEK